MTDIEQSWHRLNRECNRLIAENRRLREALEFYANWENYMLGPSGESSERDTVMEIDRGRRARDAIAACGREMEMP